MAAAEAVRMVCLASNHNAVLHDGLSALCTLVTELLLIAFETAGLVVDLCKLTLERTTTGTANKTLLVPVLSKSLKSIILDLQSTSSTCIRISRFGFFFLGLWLGFRFRFRFVFWCRRTTEFCTTSRTELCIWLEFLATFRTEFGLAGRCRLFLFRFHLLHSDLDGFWCRCCLLGLFLLWFLLLWLFLLLGFFLLLGGRSFLGLDGILSEDMESDKELGFEDIADLLSELLISAEGDLSTVRINKSETCDGNAKLLAQLLAGLGQRGIKVQTHTLCNVPKGSLHFV